MPKFFFHFVQKHEVCPDTEGVELSDERAAHRHATQIADEVRRCFGDGVDCRDWRIEVAAANDQCPMLTVLIPAIRKAPIYHRRLVSESGHVA
jgi:hypothetical protein